MSLQPSNFGLHVSAFGYVWDVDTLSVVPMRQPVIATDTLNVDADVTDRPARQLGIVTVDGTVAVTQGGAWPVTVASLPLPSGAATEAKQDTGNSSLASVDGKTPALVAGRVPVDGSAVTQPVSGAVTANATTYATRLDEASATISYVGRAVPGTSAAAASWEIKRLDSSTISVLMLFADGNGNFDNVWDNRAALSYS